MASIRIPVVRQGGKAGNLGIAFLSGDVDGGDGKGFYVGRSVDDDCRVVEFAVYELLELG